MSDADRTSEVIPFTSDYESTYQVPLANFIDMCNDKYAEERCMLKVDRLLSVPIMDRNFIPPCVMKEAGSMRGIYQSSSRRLSID